MRAALLVIGSLLIAIGAALGAAHAPGAVQALALGLVLVVALLIERWRYRRPARRAGFQATGERFRDPTSGELLQVEYDPITGERRYTRIDHSVDSLPDKRDI